MKKSELILSICLIIGTVSMVSTLAMVYGSVPGPSMGVTLTGNTLYVGGGGPGNYTTIQSAIDNASNGDTVFVYNETYYENVDVNKPLTIQSKYGSINCIVEAANTNDHVFEVTADYVDICGFTVKGSHGNLFPSGIYLDHVNHCNIIDNNANSNYPGDGIYLYHSNNNTIHGNNASNNTGGIALFSSSNNTLNGNIANLNSPGDGIYLHDSNNNTFTGNIINFNNQCGIYSGISSNNTFKGNTIKSNNYAISLFFSCNDNTITGNTIINNYPGIEIHSCINCIIINNTITNNGLWGVHIDDSSNNTIMGNTLTNNVDGICFNHFIPSGSSNNNNIMGNTIKNNTGYGINLSSSSGNIIYHNNFIGNNNQANDNGNNNWDNGYPSGGNYWSDFDEPHEGAYDNYNGPNQDIPSGDGIVDGGSLNPYNIPGGNNQDRYPLMEPYIFDNISCLDLTFSTDKVNYSVGETVNISLKVTNTCDSWVNLTTGGYDFDCEITNEAGDKVFCLCSDGKPLLTLLIDLNWPPHGTLYFNYSWNLTGNNCTYGLPFESVPTGEYDITAWLHLLYNDMNLSADSVTVTINKIVNRTNFDIIQLPNNTQVRYVIYDQICDGTIVSWETERGFIALRDEDGWWYSLVPPLSSNVWNWLDQTVINVGFEDYNDWEYTDVFLHILKDEQPGYAHLHIKEKNSQSGCANPTSITLLSNVTLCYTVERSWTSAIEKYINKNVTFSLFPNDAYVGHYVDIYIELGDDINPPITTMIVGNPNFGDYVTSETPFTLNATDNNSGVNHTFYRVWYNGAWSDWAEYTSPFTLEGECIHIIEYYSVDNAGNIEAIHSQTHYVDNTAPVSGILIGDPHHGDFVTSHTPITLFAQDYGGCTSEEYRITYRVRINGIWGNWIWGDWNCNITLNFTGLSLFDLEWYCVDRLGLNESGLDWGGLHGHSCSIDNVPPGCSSTPGIIAGWAYGDFVFPGCIFTLTCEDYGGDAGPVGSYLIFYRIWWNGSWTPWLHGEWNSSVTFTLPEECMHHIEWYAIDDLGNNESEPNWMNVHNHTLYVDDTPSETMVDAITPYHQVVIPFGISVSGNDYGCMDGCGIMTVILYYRYSPDNSTWGEWQLYDGNDTISPYQWSFTPPDGNGYYEFYSMSVDYLGNPEIMPGSPDAHCMIQMINVTTIYVDSSTQTVSCEEPFTINIMIDPIEPIAGVQLDVMFDAALITVDSVSQGDLFDGYDIYFNPGVIDNVNGSITGIVAVITTPGGNVISPGTFASISFTAKNTNGVSPLNLSDVIVGNTAAEPIQVSVLNGNVTIVCCPRSNAWDVNNDGRVNILDLILVGQHWQETGEPCWIAMDVNGDGTVNILDLILVGQHWTG